MLVAGTLNGLLKSLNPADSLLITDPEGRILVKVNESKKRVPASILKILTTLAAIHHLGETYRFRTEFYLDENRNLKIKGTGDPFLISEAWEEIADDLAKRLDYFSDLVLDISHFAPDLSIPGISASTNPYDAPNGALCANFNTVFFRRDRRNTIVSAEPQTPMVPYASERIRGMGLRGGRHSIFHNAREAAIHAGEILAHFLGARNVRQRGRIIFGSVASEDELIYVYRSALTLEQILGKMLEHSNNFIANQVLIALGAALDGPPGTLQKGVGVLSDYAEEVIHLRDIDLAEGSGISRKNRLSALDFLEILRRFKPYRTLLESDGRLLYKTGSLKNVNTRAGYIECGSDRPSFFVILQNGSKADIEFAIENLKKFALAKCKSRD
jgi:D-alanyl-D-alanine carboxypeptidase/D-alanyl-D-alanine-endopeptidase (penicillin-binding protein 4)